MAKNDVHKVDLFFQNRCGLRAEALYSKTWGHVTCCDCLAYKAEDQQKRKDWLKAQRKGQKP